MLKHANIEVYAYTHLRNLSKPCCECCGNLSQFSNWVDIIKSTADQILNELGISDPILEIAKGLEKEALNDSYFIKRKLYPNVDFYSGIIYKALEIPNEMFTVMFALGRLPGWIAHWREMRLNNEPIGRPRQIYTGETLRDFKEIESR